MKRDWVDIRWTEFAAADASQWIAVLPVGAVEQHGPHLPLGVDAAIAEAYLRRVRERLPADLPAVFLPLQTLGVSVEHAGFAGTLSLSPATMLAVLRDIGESVQRAGLRKLVIVNSHGGNSPVLDIAARELRAAFGLFVVATSWARFGYPDGLFADGERRFGIHAGDIETSLMLAARPDAVDMAGAKRFPSSAESMASEFKWLNTDRPAGFGWMTQDLNPRGAVGDAARATAAKGEAALDHGAAAFIDLLREVNGFDLGRLANRPTP